MQTPPALYMYMTPLLRKIKIELYEKNLIPKWHTIFDRVEESWVAAVFEVVLYPQQWSFFDATEEEMPCA